MTQHGAYSIIVNVREGMQQQLAELLQKIVDDDVETNSIVPFKNITSIHFARFVLLDKGEDAEGRMVAARLAFTTNFDMPLDSHLKQMIDVAGPGLWRIFSMCEGFPAGDYNPTLLQTFLAKNDKNSETFYVGVGYRSVQQIRNENLLRNAINDYVDSNRTALLNQTAVASRKQIIDFVNASPEMQWAKTPVPPASFKWNFTFLGKPIVLLLLFIVFIPLIIPFVIIWMLIMLYHEIHETQAPNPVTKDHIRALVNKETQLVQAQFSALGNLKPGKFRHVTMMFLLRATNFLAPHLFSKGRLSGIPTVHFARWLIIDEGRQMLFLSNYDGNSENYLRDFIHIAAKQLTLMFCHAEGYPKTRLMVFGGAKDAEGFMAWARYRQVITNVWYSAYKQVSVKNIYNNSKIRNGLYGSMTEAEAQKWLGII